MKKIMIAIGVALGLVVASAGAAQATVQPPESYVLALWVQDDPANLWPQTLVASQPQSDKSLSGLDHLAVNGCYQADIYKDDAITAALLAGGHLYGAENPDESWPGDGSYHSSYSKVWCVTPAEPNAAGTVTAECSAFTATLTNELGEAPSRLTASGVVYVDGVFHEALVATGGSSTVSVGTFAEDSGDHVVQLRTGPAFGDLLLAEATVTSDCVTPPVVEEPPVDTPPTTIVTQVPPKELVEAGPADVFKIVGGALALLGTGGLLLNRRRIFG